MEDDYKNKKIKKNLSTTDSESLSTDSCSISEISESSSYEVDVVKNTKPNIDDVIFLTERSKIFISYEKLGSCIIDSLFLQNNDVIFFSIILMNYSSLLSSLSKKFKKNVNSMISQNLEKLKKIINVTDNDKIEAQIKNNMIFVFTERFCNVAPFKILNLYKEISVEDSKLYIFLSKLYRIDPDEKEDVLKSFVEYKDITDLDFLPHRIEEIHLLGCSDIFKNITLSDVNYRIYLLTGKDLRNYIKLIENDLEENK